jgi:EmrB/QacA subfamily drug resistance transporter
MTFALRHRQRPPTHAAYAGDDPRRWVALGVLLLAAAMDLIDTTVATLALPVIGDELGAGSAALEWIIAGYALAFALGLITGGRLGDVFGRRRVFLIGLVGFTAASALCGLAPTAEILVAARVVQGAFAALMIPQVVSIIAASFPPADRARAYGMMGAVAGLATVAGPLLSGVLLEVDLFSWRPIFLINIPIGLVTIAAARAFVHESRSEDPPRLDLAGAGLLTAALVLLLFPLVEGHQLGWPAWTFAAMAGSLPALGLFAVHQRRRGLRGASPLVPPALFRRRAFAGGTLATLAFFSGPPALLFVITITLQALGFSPLHTALTFVPLSLASVPAAAASVALAPRLGRNLMVGGALVVALGIAGLLLAVELAGAALTTWTLLPGLIVTGLGLGLVAPTLIDVVLAGVDPRDVGAASGVRSTASQLGGAIGVALIGLVFYGALPARALDTDAVDSYTHALSSGLWYALAIAILSALPMLLLPKPPRSPHRDAAARTPSTPPSQQRAVTDHGAIRVGARYEALHRRLLDQVPGGRDQAGDRGRLKWACAVCDERRGMSQ